MRQYISPLSVWSISYVQQIPHSGEMEKSRNAWQRFMADFLLCKCEEKQRCIRLISFEEEDSWLEDIEITEREKGGPDFNSEKKKKRIVQ